MIDRLIRTIFFCISIQGSENPFEINRIVHKRVTENKPKRVTENKPIKFLQDKEVLKQELEVIRRRQEQAVKHADEQARDRNEYAVGTAEELDTQIAQALISQVYRKIALSAFYEKFYPQIVEITENTRYYFQLSKKEQISFYKKLSEKFSSELQAHNLSTVNKTIHIAHGDEGRSVTYILQGNITLDAEKKIPQTPQAQDLLFKLKPAQERIINNIKEYISTDYDLVSQACLTPELTYTSSSQVIAMPCCQQQFHRDCVQVALANHLAICINSSCRIKQAEHYVQTSVNYKDILEQSQVLEGEQVAAVTCLFCLDELKPKEQLKRALNANPSYTSVKKYKRSVSK